MIASPLNYTGGKYKLLSQILPLFPHDINTFVDLFCGGCNVGLNVPANQVLYNDIDSKLLSFYNALKSLDEKSIFECIHQIIDEYELSLTSENGYAFYCCDSNTGLARYNREKFLRLRAELNRRMKDGPWDHYLYIMYYVAIVYAFNNQIRYNRKGEYNIPVGKRDFNLRMQQKLSAFIARIQEQNCCFTCRDFRQVNTEHLGPNDFLYADPPYLITCAAYNEQGGWSEEDERDLLSLLDILHDRHIRFALSNVLRSKDRENTILLEWLAAHEGQYTAFPLRVDYSNSNYHRKRQAARSEEVLIVNYR